MREFPGQKNRAVTKMRARSQADSSFGHKEMFLCGTKSVQSQATLMRLIPRLSQGTFPFIMLRMATGVFFLPRKNFILSRTRSQGTDSVQFRFSPGADLSVVPRHLYFFRGETDFRTSYREKVLSEANRENGDVKDFGPMKMQAVRDSPLM